MKQVCCKSPLDDNTLFVSKPDTVFCRVTGGKLGLLPPDRKLHRHKFYSSRSQMQSSQRSKVISPWNGVQEGLEGQSVHHPKVLPHKDPALKNFWTPRRVGFEVGSLHGYTSQFWIFMYRPLKDSFTPTSIPALTGKVYYKAVISVPHSERFTAF